MFDAAIRQVNIFGKIEIWGLFISRIIRLGERVRYQQKTFILAVLLSRDSEERAICSRVIREILATVFLMRKPHLQVVNDNLKKLCKDGVVARARKDPENELDDTWLWYITNTGKSEARSLIGTEIDSVTKRINDNIVLKKGLEKCVAGLEDYVYDTLQARYVR